MAINTLSLVWRKMLSFIEDPVETGETAIKTVLRNAYDSLGDVLRIQETDPLNYQMAWDVIEESSMGTAGSPYVYFLDTDAYNLASIQIAITLGSASAGGVALSIYATVEDDDADMTARVFLDRTLELTGSSTITVSDIIEDIDAGNYTAIKLSVAVTNASNDSAVKIDVKRSYS